MQLAMSLAFVSGKLSARNMMHYARRIEIDIATMRAQQHPGRLLARHRHSSAGVLPALPDARHREQRQGFFRDLLWGGPNRNALLRQRRLEPGQRECVAIVIMPSFVPYADLTVTSNWFNLTNPKHKVMDSEFAMGSSKSVKTIEKCGPSVLDAECYRDGDLDAAACTRPSSFPPACRCNRPSCRFPTKTRWAALPCSTRASPTWPGTQRLVRQPVHQPQSADHHVPGRQPLQRSPDARDRRRPGSAMQEMLSRQVMKVVIPPFPNLVGDTVNGKFVDVQLATPYGVSQHLLEHPG